MAGTWSGTPTNRDPEGHLYEDPPMVLIYDHTPHQEQANSCNVLSSVASGLKSSKYHHGDDYRDQSTDEVP